MMVKPIGTVFIAGDSFGELKGKSWITVFLEVCPVFFWKKHEYQSLYGRVSFCKRNGADARV